MKIVLNYDSANDFREGMASVCRDGKWGFIDTSGNEVVPCKYDCVDYFHEGMARVNIGGRWCYSEMDDEHYISGGETGFVDKTGREVIPCLYENVHDFHEGMAQVWVGGERHYDEEDGEEVLSGCKKLTEIEIPLGVKIADNAFEGCPCKEEVMKKTK